MFTGMLKVLHNADSLAVVLGHEMAHVVLQHAVCNDNNYCLCRKLNELQCQSENEVASELNKI